MLINVKPLISESVIRTNTKRFKLNPDTNGRPNINNIYLYKHSKKTWNKPAEQNIGFGVDITILVDVKRGFERLKRTTLRNKYSCDNVSLFKT